MKLLFVLATEFYAPTMSFSNKVRFAINTFFFFLGYIYTVYLSSFAQKCTPWFGLLCVNTLINKSLTTSSLKLIFDFVETTSNSILGNPELHKCGQVHDTAPCCGERQIPEKETKTQQ